MGMMAGWTIDTVDPAVATPSTGWEAMPRQVVGEPVGRQPAQA